MTTPNKNASSKKAGKKTPDPESGGVLPRRRRKEAFPESEESNESSAGSSEKERPLSVGVHTLDLRTARFLNAYGIRTHEDLNMKYNAHALSAGFRKAAEAFVVGQVVEAGKQLLVCYPRKHEIQNYERSLRMKGHKPAVLYFRPQYHPGDAAGCRPIAASVVPNSLALLPHHTHFVVTDVYEESLVTLVRNLWGLMVHDGTERMMLHGTVITRDVRPLVAIERVVAPAQPARSERVKKRQVVYNGKDAVLHEEASDPLAAKKQAEGPVHLRAGQPVTFETWETVETPAVPGDEAIVSLLVGGITDADAESRSHTALTLRGDAEVTYVTGMGYSDLFYYSRKVIHDGRDTTWVIDRKHEDRIGAFHVFSVAIWFVKESKPSIQSALSLMPQEGLVNDDLSGPLMAYAARKAISVDTTDDAKVVSYYRLIESHADALLGNAKDVMLRLYSDQLAQCVRLVARAAIVTSRSAVPLLPASLSPVALSVATANKIELVDTLGWMGEVAAIVKNSRTKFSLVVNVYQFLREKAHAFLAMIHSLLFGSSKLLDLEGLTGGQLNLLQPLWNLISGAASKLFKRIQKVVRFALWLVNRLKGSFGRIHWGTWTSMQSLSELLTSFLYVLGEELVKRYLINGAIFGAIEWLIKDVVFGYFCSTPSVRQVHSSWTDVMVLAVQYIARVCAHSFLAAMPLVPAVILHAAYNYACANKSAWARQLGDLMRDWEVHEHNERHAVFGVDSCEYSATELSDNVFVTDGLVEIPAKTWLSVYGETFAPHNKVALIAGVSAANVGKPGKSIGAVLNMVATRLEAPVLKCHAAHTRQLFSVYCRFLWEPVLVFHKEAGPLGEASQRSELMTRTEAWQPEQMWEYIQDRPFTKAKKLTRESWLLEMQDQEALIPSKGKISMYLKTDELLKVRHGVDGTLFNMKERPIFPLTSADMSLMCWGVPFKAAVMKGLRSWEACGITFGYYIVGEGSMADLEEVVQYFRPKRAVVALSLGDDVLWMVFRGDGSFSCAAADAVSCDLSCGRVVQELISADWVSHGLSEEDRLRYLTNLSGTVDIEIGSEDFPDNLRLLLRKKVKSTNTGSPMTSVVALYALGAPIVNTLQAISDKLQVITRQTLLNRGTVDWYFCNEEPNEPNLRGEVLATFELFSKTVGLRMEWEISRRFHEPQAVSFLGRYLFWNSRADRYQFIALNFAKNSIATNPTHIFPGDSSESAWAKFVWALSMNPDMDQTPFGRHFQRIAQSMIAAADVPEDDAETAGLAYWNTQNYWAQEKFRWVSDVVLCDEDFYWNLEINCRIRKIEDGVARYQTSLIEMELADSFPFASCEDGIWWELKFGPRDTLDDWRLDLVSVLLRKVGGLKIYSSFNSFQRIFSMPHGKNDRVKSTKSVTEKSRKGPKGGEIVVHQQRDSETSARSRRHTGRIKDESSRITEVEPERKPGRHRGRRSHNPGSLVGVHAHLGPLHAGYDNERGWHVGWGSADDAEMREFAAKHGLARTWSEAVDAHLATDPRKTLPKGSYVGTAATKAPENRLEAAKVNADYQRLAAINGGPKSFEEHVRATHRAWGGNMPESFRNAPPRECEFYLPFDEAVLVLNATTTSVLTTITVNAGNGYALPQSAGVARLFQMYHPISWEYYFVPQVTAGTVNSSGSIVLSFGLDTASEAPPIDYEHQVNNTIHADTQPIYGCSLEVAGPANNRRAATNIGKGTGDDGQWYVGEGEEGFVPPGREEGLSNLGQLTVGIYGQGSSSGQIGIIRTRGILGLNKRIDMQEDSIPRSLTAETFVSGTGFAPVSGTTYGVNFIKPTSTAAVNGSRNFAFNQNGTSASTLVASGPMNVMFIGAVFASGTASTASSDLLLVSRVVKNNALVYENGAAGESFATGYYNISCPLNSTMIPVLAGDILDIRLVLTAATGTVGTANANLSFLTVLCLP